MVCSMLDLSRLVHGECDSNIKCFMETTLLQGHRSRLKHVGWGHVTWELREGETSELGEGHGSEYGVGYESR